MPTMTGRLEEEVAPVQVAVLEEARDRQPSDTGT